MPSRLPLWIAAGPSAAVVLAGLRWWWQGSSNVYSARHHGYYQLDDDLGWRFVEDGPIWLGLDAIGALVAAALALMVVARWARSRSWSPGRLGALGALGLATLVVPVAAWLSGMPPADARERRPEVEVVGPGTSEITASLPSAPSGRYTVASVPELSSVVATVSAGGEEFETRFSGVFGHFEGAPADLSAALSAHVEVDPRTVDTGVELRSKHALDYLQVESFPTMVLTLGSLSATEAIEPGTVSFSATAELQFVGDRLRVPLEGTLRFVDAAAAGRLGLDAPLALAVVAQFSITIADTKLSAHATDFSATTIPLRVELVLIPEPSPPDRE